MKLWSVKESRFIVTLHMAFHNATHVFLLMEAASSESAHPLRQAMGQASLRERERESREGGSRRLHGEADLLRIPIVQAEPMDRLTHRV